MTNCEISIHLAYGMAIYVFASIFYLIFTRNIGTPFNDSLTSQQTIIKNKSAGTRRRIFYSGIAVGCVLSFFLRPFNKC
jgi:hypothetical protein